MASTGERPRPERQHRAEFVLDAGIACESTVRRNSDHASFPRSVSLDDADLPFDFDPAVITNLDTDADSHFNNDAIAIPRKSGSSSDPILTKRCGYEATIKVRRRLHTGDHHDDWDTYGSSIFYWGGGSP